MIDMNVDQDLYSILLHEHVPILALIMGSNLIVRRRGYVSGLLDKSILPCFDT
jgi:hypothetical protein